MKPGKDILRDARIDVSPQSFSLVSIGHGEWIRILENPELSPRMTAPFMILKDQHEVTLLLDDIDFATIHHAIRDAKTERGLRLLTFDVELDLSATGFLAEVSRILADAEISLIAVSAFSRDHLLVKQTDLSAALRAFGPFVKELC
ncbi:MAG: ACT domain-containing protein [Pyrinomonadaceae bacterium]